MFLPLKNKLHYLILSGQHADDEETIIHGIRSVYPYNLMAQMRHLENGGND
jgi:hypothetical protein